MGGILNKIKNFISRTPVEKSVSEYVPTNPHYFVKINDHALELWECVDNTWRKTGSAEHTDKGVEITPDHNMTLDTMPYLMRYLVNTKTVALLLQKECDLLNRQNKILEKEILDENFVDDSSENLDGEIDKIENQVAELEKDIIDKATFDKILYGQLASNSDVASRKTGSKYSNLHMPKKVDNSLLETIVSAYFVRKNLITVKSAVWFTVYDEIPELLEYVGELDPIKKLINNEEYFSRLLIVRRDYYQYLITTKGAGLNTMTFAFLNKDGECLGFFALWNNKTKFVVFDDNLQKDLSVFSELS